MTHVYEIGKLDKEHVNYMLLLDYVQSCPKYNFDLLDFLYSVSRHINH